MCRERNNQNNQTPSVKMHSLFIPISLTDLTPVELHGNAPLPTAIPTNDQNKPSLATKATHQLSTKPPLTATPNHNSNHLQRDPFPAINTPPIQNNTQQHHQNQHSMNNTTDIVNISLTSLALQRQIQSCIKQVFQSGDVTEEKENAHISSNTNISAQVALNDAKDTWGITLRGPSMAALEAIKSDLMRSPALRMLASPNHSVLPDADLLQEVYLNSSPEIDEDLPVKSASCQATFDCAPFGVNCLLGPKHALLYELRIHDSLALVNVSSNRILLSAPNSETLTTASALLVDRLERLSRLNLATTTVQVDADKEDWLSLSGRMARFEESLWRYGVSLEKRGDSWTLQGLSASLLKKCVDRLQEMLTRHQSLQLTFACRDDIRDYPLSLQEALESLAQVHNCTAKHSGNGCQMRVCFTGDSDDLAALLSRIESLSLAPYSQDIRLQDQRLTIQLPSTIRDFISGKKEGKLVRIMKESGAMVTLSPETEQIDSMFVELVVVGNGAMSQGRLVMAQQLLLGELPAQLSFHVPETHHKRMIGHGGKAIQRIMKKWGVYVKFLNHFEANQTFNLGDPLSGDASDTPLDNVIVRTPSKNAAALTAIKGEIFGLEESLAGLESLQAPPITRVSMPSVDLSLLKQVTLGKSVKASLQYSTLWLEGPKAALTPVLEHLAHLSRETNVVSSTASVSDEAFKHFPSALFVQSHSPSLSASGSPILGWSSVNGSGSGYTSFNNTATTANANCSPAPSASSSIVMNSLSSSPSLLPVGSKECIHSLDGGSESDEIDSMIALLHRRQQYC